MPSALFSTPRPEPGHLLPALGGAVVVLLALPVFLSPAGASPAGGSPRCSGSPCTPSISCCAATKAQTGNLAASGVQAFGLFFKSIGLLVVLIAALAASPHLAVAAALTYALAYTFELGLSLVTLLRSRRR